MHFVSTLPYGSLSCFDCWWTFGFDLMHGWVFLLVALRISERTQSEPRTSKRTTGQGEERVSNGLTAQRMLSTGLYVWAHYNLDPIFVLIRGVEWLDPKEKQQMCNAFKRIVSDFKIPCLSLQMPRSPKVIGWVGQHVAQWSKCWMFCGQHIVTLHSFLLIKSTLAVRWCIHVSTITTHLAQL